MSARHLVIGLDGADLDLIETFGPDSLPELHALLAMGAYARLESVQPPATLPNWTTFLTGSNPGTHGVFDFTVRNGYQVQFAGGQVREAPTVFERLDRLGCRCAVLSFPGLYPPPNLDHGIALSGWDSPVAFEADRSFVRPAGLYDEIVARFGKPTFDDVNELEADQDGWHDALPERLEARVARKTALFDWLLERESWDLFACYFGESDTASHYLFGRHDTESPRHPKHTTHAQREGLRKVYEALDRSVGRLIETAGPSVEITVLSDHGSGGSSDHVLYLNRALRDGGFLSFKSDSILQSLTHGLKESALTLLPPRLRAQIFRFAGASLPSRLESAARFGAIDWAHTVAFSDELNYFPAIHFNVKGREPHGIVDPDDVPTLARSLRAHLLSLRDPFSDQPVFKKVTPRDELFEGPFVDRAPDLLLELTYANGYSPNLAPSGSAPRGTGPWRRMSPEEYLGRKGRSLPGSHRPHGFFAMAGQSVQAMGEIDAHISNVTATMLARMGAALPIEASGRVLFEALHLDDIPDAAPLDGSAHSDHARSERVRTDARDSAANESVIESRLRALGYIDG